MRDQNVEHRFFLGRLRRGRQGPELERLHGTGKRACNRQRGRGREPRFDQLPDHAPGMDATFKVGVDNLARTHHSPPTVGMKFRLEIQCRIICRSKVLSRTIRAADFSYESVVASWQRTYARG